MQIQQKRLNRFKFLHGLYEKTGGRSHLHLVAVGIGAELGFDREESLDIALHLKNEGLARFHAVGPSIGITHRGVLEVEEAIERPQKPTEHFPPVINVLNVHTMVNSQVQQGTTASSQNSQFTQSTSGEIREFINHLRERMSELPLPTERTSELQSDAATVEAQLVSSNPKRGIMRESLQSIRNILEEAAGSAVASDLLPRLIPLLSAIS